jgi:DTW domain-containing protein YfiP
MRSVVRKPTERCSHCLLPPRWCLCPAQLAIHTPLQVLLMSHQRELQRPSSTGNLIRRLLPGTRQQVWVPGQSPQAEDFLLPERETWLLHPAGHPVPVGADPAQVQVVLLDGFWNEAKIMARDVAAWGRLVSLPLSGESRYWLRSKQDGERYSTAEALIYLLRTFGLVAESEALRIQFELHVYAGIRARGRVDLAAEFLAGSPIREALPEFLERLQTRRPL